MIRSSRSKKQSQSFKQQVAKAKSFLLDAQQSLPIDGDPVLPAEASALRAVGIIPVEALAVAADILGTYGETFPSFDAADSTEAYAYEVAMRDLAATARAFARKIDRSVLRRRAVPMNNALALYAAVKAIGRIDEQLDEPINRLGKLIAVGRRRTRKAAPASPSAPAAKASVIVDQPATSSPQPSTPVVVNGVTSLNGSPRGATASSGSARDSTRAPDDPAARGVAVLPMTKPQ